MAMQVTAIWAKKYPTSAHSPAPLYASTMPNVPAISVAARLQNIISRKRISRCMRATWIELKELKSIDSE